MTIELEILFAFSENKFNSFKITYYKNPNKLSNNNKFE